MKKQILIMGLLLGVVLVYAEDSDVAKASSLQATIKGNTVELSWSASIKEDKRGFEIQKSRDGIHWYRIGWEKKREDTINRPHFFIDRRPCPGVNYYRYRQKDFDEKFVVSQVVVVDFRKPKICLFPNPATKTVTVADNSGCSIKTVGIYNDSGRKMIFTIPKNGKIDLSGLPQGMYILEVATNEGVVIEKLLVE